MGGARFDCGPLFVQAHLALTDELKRVVAAYVKEILAAPLGPSRTGRAPCAPPA